MQKSQTEANWIPNLDEQDFYAWTQQQSHLLEHQQCLYSLANIFSDRFYLGTPATDELME